MCSCMTTLSRVEQRLSLHQAANSPQARHLCMQDGKIADP